MEKTICTKCNEENSNKAKYCMYCGYEIPGYDPHKKPEPQVAQATKTPPSKKWITVVAGVSVCIIMFFVGQGLVETLFSFDKAMMKMASELNEACPMMADSDTRLDNAVAIPGNSFQYNFTLINLSKAEIDIEDLRTYMIPQITNNIRTNPDMLVFRENLVTLIYVYKDKAGEHITKIKVSPQQYQE